MDAREDRLAYSYDAFVTEAMPEAVLLPETTDEVAAVMTIANREGIPVTARGAGTSICGAPVPAKNGIVLAFTRYGWWRGKDSNLRRHKPTGFQPVTFSHSGTPPPFA